MNFDLNLAKKFILELDSDRFSREQLLSLVIEKFLTRKEEFKL
jgi:hypothetical protein